jgi:hypothetical protein
MDRYPAWINNALVDQARRIPNLSTPSPPPAPLPSAPWVDNALLDQAMNMSRLQLENEAEGARAGASSEAALINKIRHLEKEAEVARATLASHEVALIDKIRHLEKEAEVARAGASREAALMDKIRHLEKEAEGARVGASRETPCRE